MPRKKEAPIKTCPWCYERFEQKREWQVYCNKRCRWSAWNEAHPRKK